MERTAEQTTRRRGRQVSISDVAPPVAGNAGRSARNGTALLQQQCWLWGRDVQRIEGNLLVEYGFEKTPPPRTEWGSSCYTYAPTPHSTIRLWGFGVLLADQRHGAIFLQRSAFEPRIVSDASVAAATIWRPEQVSGTRAPRLPQDGDAVLALLPPLLAWIGAYEQWVRDTYGLEYRLGALRGWSPQACTADELPARWWDLAAGWRELLSARG